MTNIPRGAERTRPIQATETNTAFLGLHFDNDFADGVPNDLRRQCPNGKVTGVYAKYESTWYVLVEKRAVTAKAYCVPAEVTQIPASTQSAPWPAPQSAPSTAPQSAPAVPSVLPLPPPPPAPAASRQIERTGGSS